MLRLLPARLCVGMVGTILAVTPQDRRTGRNKPGDDPMVAHHPTEGRQPGRWVATAGDGKPRGGGIYLPVGAAACVHPQGWLLPVTQRRLISQWEGREIMLRSPI